MAPPLTPMQRIAIVALRNSGCRVSDIARRTGISKPSIHLWLKRYEETGDITARHRQVYKRATTAEQDAAIVAAHANQPYLSTAETAKMFNVTKDTIRRRLKEGGLEHKKERGGGYGKSNRIKQEIKKEKPKFNLADYKIEPGTWAYEPPSASSSKPLLELEVPPLVEVKLEVESDAEPFSPPPPPPAKKPRRRSTRTSKRKNASSSSELPQKRSPRLKSTPLASPARPETSQPATCSACRLAIPAWAPLYRCVQCAGGALLCASCQPAAHAHRLHCLMRMPSTRVHSILEGLFQKLQLDVNELLCKKSDFGGQVASEIEPGQSEELIKQDEDELIEDEPILEQSKPAPYLLLTGLQITQPSSSPYDPLDTIFKEEDPLSAEDADDSIDPPSSPVSKAKPKRKARGSRKRKAESAIPGTSAGGRKKAFEEASTSPLRPDDVSMSQDEEVDIKDEPPALDGAGSDDGETQEVFIKTESVDGDVTDEEQYEMVDPRERSPQAPQSPICEDPQSSQIGEALDAEESSQDEAQQFQS